MKNRKNLLTGVLILAIIAWLVGFFSLSMSTEYGSFGLGFLFCLLLLPIGYLLWKIRNGHSSSWTRHAVLIILAGLIATTLFIRQDMLFHQLREEQSSYRKEQAILLESIRQSNQGVLLNNLLNKLDDELKDRPLGILSEEAMARTIALGNAFEPYPVWSGDSLSADKLSPERGHLLKALALMQIDSTSFDTIKARTSFAGAMLEGGDLTGAYLNLADLQKANMKKATLVGALLNHSDLRKSQLWGADLSHAHIKESDLKRAEANWAELSGAYLTGSDLNGISLRDANVRRADLSETLIQWADLRGTFFTGSNMSTTDFLGTNMSETNLKEVDLSHSNLTRAILKNADLTGANLSNAAVQNPKWLDKLTEWRVIGAEDIQQNYILIDDTVRPRQYHDARFRLKKVDTP